VLWDLGVGGLGFRGWALWFLRIVAMEMSSWKFVWRAFDASSGVDVEWRWVSFFVVEGA